MSLPLTSQVRQNWCIVGRVGRSSYVNSQTGLCWNRLPHSCPHHTTDAPFATYPPGPAAAGFRCGGGGNRPASHAPLPALPPGRAALRPVALAAGAPSTCGWPKVSGIGGGNVAGVFLYIYNIYICVYTKHPTSGLFLDCFFMSSPGPL